MLEQLKGKKCKVYFGEELRPLEVMVHDFGDGFIAITRSTGSGQPEFYSLRCIRAIMPVDPL